METKSWILIIVIVAFIILSVLFIIYLRRKIKSNKKIKEEIPEELLNDLKRAEELYEKAKGKMTQNEVLWQLWKERGSGLEPLITPIEPVESKETKLPEPPKGINLNKLFKK